MIDTNQDSIPIKVYSGDLEIIGNGIVPTTQDRILKIKVDTLEFQFYFVKDENEKSKIGRKVVDGKMHIILTNFNKSLGIGMIEPIPIGTLKGKELFISLWVWTPSEKDEKRIINWTLLQGSEVQKD